MITRSTAPADPWNDYRHSYRKGAPVSGRHRRRDRQQSAAVLGGLGRRGQPHQNNDHYSRTPDAVIRFAVFGTAFRYWFSMAPQHGIAEVTIDTQVVAQIDQYAPLRMDGMTSWTSPGLQNGRHDVSIRVTGTKNPASSGTVVTVDRLDVTEDD